MQVAFDAAQLGAIVDLIGEGNLGLMTAARKFDPDRGVKFISYAVWWVRQAVLKALAEQTAKAVARARPRWVAHSPLPGSSRRSGCG